MKNERDEASNRSHETALYWGSLVLGVGLMLIPFAVHAADWGIGGTGTDKSKDMVIFSSLAKSVEGIVVLYAAPGLGGCLCFYGIWKIAVRDAMVGVIAVLGGGALFFLGNILEALKKIGA